MADRRSNWHDASDTMHPTCPFCGNDRDITREATEWICPCGHKWQALNRNDRRFLESIRIDPSE